MEAKRAIDNIVCDLFLSLTGVNLNESGKPALYGTEVYNSMLAELGLPDHNASLERYRRLATHFRDAAIAQLRKYDYTGKY